MFILILGFFIFRAFRLVVHLKTVYVTNLVFSLETIVLLYFVTSIKLDIHKAFFILITFSHIFQIPVVSYFRYFTFKLCVRMKLWNYGYNTPVFSNGETATIIMSHFNFRHLMDFALSILLSLLFIINLSVWLLG